MVWVRTLKCFDSVYEKTWFRMGIIMAFYLNRFPFGTLCCLYDSDDVNCKSVERWLLDEWFSC